MAQFNGFKGDYKGLNEEEVLTNRSKYGLNELTKTKKITFFHKVIEIIKEPMFLLLLVTASFYFFLGEPVDGAIMLVFVTLMLTINILQEWKTEKALQALKELSSPKVKVIRNEKLIEIDTTQLTVNDLMILEEGDKVSADGLILEMNSLSVDESTLTGESAVVWKSLVHEEPNTRFKANICYAGTSVTYGSAIVKVIAVGPTTEYGKIGTLILNVEGEKSPLDQQIDKLVKYSGIFAFVLFSLVLLFSFLNSDGESFQSKLVESILASITVAMSMIPEEFPVILTIFLAMGSYRLTKQHALIRKIPATETLGSVSILCVDKTGTLTQNEMVIQDLYIHRSKEELLEYMELACEVHPYDPMEKSIVQYVINQGFKSKREEYSFLHDYAFMQQTKMMGHVFQTNSQVVVAAKGSFENVLKVCNLSVDEQESLRVKHDQMASNGYRVIAVAKAISDEEIKENLQDYKYTFLGMIGFEDPPREGVKEAIEMCYGAGIRVLMITGDHAITASSIASKIGIHNGNILTGDELDLLSDDELRIKIKDVNVVARAIPEQKLRIVKALKANGEIVGMTGDGVNDTPALKASDIGIAMGKRGTHVAKEVADLIILDDNFTTIVETVKDGRRIYDNIKKSVEYVIVMHIIIAFLALVPSILGLPLLLLPIHIVLLEMIIDPTCSIIFERQPAELDIMKRKPRKKEESIVDKSVILKSIMQALLVVLFSLGSYLYLLNSGNEVELARAFTLVVVILSSLFLVYVNQSNTESTWKVLLRKLDRTQLFINATIFTLLVVAIYVPIGHQIFKTETLPLPMLLIAIGFSILGTLWYEVLKLVKRRKK